MNNPPHDWDLKGVAVLALRDAKIVMIREEEGNDRPSAGKYAGMASIPMGVIRPGETAEQAAVREFGEETGLVVRLSYPIGFFEIQEPDRNRAGIWAFFGRLTGERVIRGGDISVPFVLSEHDFLGLDPFDVRPLNREIYTQWKLLAKLIKGGKGIGWVRAQAIYHAPIKARRWLAGE